MAELDPRKQTILRAVVFEFVRGAEPVASEILTARYPLGVKSATVRNELAELTDQGYLEQPHSSAGRIPNDTAYRYFVDRLMVLSEPDPEARQRVKSATQEGDALKDLVTESTKLLSRMTSLLTAASIVKNSTLTIRSVVISALGPKQALLVVALSNGEVENRMLELPAELTLTELGMANEQLTRLLLNQPLKSAARQKAPMVNENPGAERLLGIVWTALRSISKEVNRPTLITSGEEFLLGQPEFTRDASKLASLVEALQQEEALGEAISDPTARNISIGKENKFAEHQELSVVRRQFFIGDNEVGVIAVVGPTRMAYDRSVSLVDYTAKALSEALTRYLG